MLSLYAVTLVFLAMGFAAFASRGHAIPLLLGMATIVILVCAGRLSFSREWFAVGRILGNSLGMRQEVHYALALTRWLALEGGRCCSVEELWESLVFAAQRLGFRSVRLTLVDGQRAWSDAGGCEPCHSIRQELQNGRCGILELTAPACDTDISHPASACPRPPACRRPFCPSVSDGRVFGIISDLLMEGWMKAAMKWNNGEPAALRFDAKVAWPKDRQRNGFLPPPAPVQDMVPSPKTVNSPDGSVVG